MLRPYVAQFFYFHLLQTKKEYFMSRQIQIRRGSATSHNNFIGAIGEITVDTTNWTLRVHDGITPGGHVVVSDAAGIIDCITEMQFPSAENGYTWYRKYNSGWTEQGGTNNGTGPIMLPITMADTNYTAIAMPKAFDSFENVGCLTINLLTHSKTTSSFNVQVRWNGGGASTADARFDWVVYGRAG